MRILLLAGLAVSLLACSGPERRVDPTPRARPIDAGLPAPEPEPEPEGLRVPEDERAPEGAACTSSGDCGAGEQCRGAPGCRSGWACGTARECMDESVAYCDCDGTTFYAAGGCPGRAYMHVGPCSDVGEAIAAGAELGIHDWDEPPTEDTRACESSSDCSAGRICWGVPGCATRWSCVRARCTRDSVSFCGCDGATFRGSSTCPGRPFVHRGPCRDAVASAEIDAGARDAGTAIASTRPPRDAGAAIARVDRDAGTDAAIAVVASMPPGPRGCRSSRDCRRGLVCQGPPGCGEDVEWTCGRPEQECIRDTQVFCDCEGRDFRASMFCPAQPYRHRGSCEIDRMLDLSGAAPR